MNPRHTAALALVGWYLMLPPLRQPSLIARASAWVFGGHLVKETDSDAPIATWVQSGEFESLNACKSQQDHLYADANRKIATPPISWQDLDDQAYLGQLAFGHCIASDDPRLKGK
jgi:hypothetical protein